MTLIARRSFLIGLLAAPAIVHIDNIMKIAPFKLTLPSGPFYRKIGALWIPDSAATIHLSDLELLSIIRTGTNA